MWFFISRASITKIQKLQERALRFVLKDYTSDHETLLSKGDVDSFRISALKTMAVEIYKILNGTGPKYLSPLLSRSITPYNLRDQNKLMQPLKRTTTFGIKSLTYYGTHLWNRLPNDVKDALILIKFKTLVRKWMGPTRADTAVVTFIGLVSWYRYLTDVTYYVNTLSSLLIYEHSNVAADKVQESRRKVTK